VDFETNLQQRFDVQRLHIQPYSPKAGTGLSSHEVNQPGSYRDVTDTTVYQKQLRLLYQLFKGFGAVDILAWTTTWNLPSNTALYCRFKIDCVLVKHSINTLSCLQMCLAKT
jgi:isoleucyl-tRNA synthetase